MKKRLYGLLTVSFILGLTACGVGNSSDTNSQSSPAPPTAETDAPSPDNEQAAGEQGGTLVVGDVILDTQMAAINPFVPSNTAGGLLKMIYEKLLFFNSITGELEPEFASGYEWSEDNMTLTYTINTDNVWHDGQPVSAQDVVFTYTALKNEPVLDRYMIMNKIDSITADGNKVIFELNQTFLSLPYYMTEIYIVPKHIWENAESVSEELNTNPVGSGPFIYRGYNVGTDIQLDANKNYWRGAPKVDEMIIQMYNSSPNLTLALLQGEIGATMGTIAVANIPELKTKENFVLQLASGFNNFMIYINHENELLRDINVRKAMSMAINQEDLITKGEYNGVFPASSGWMPEVFGDLQSEYANSAHVYDPQAAMELLESAGYTKGTDGIYQKDGKRLSFTYHNAAGAPAQQMEAGMLQQWLLNIGIEIIPRLATWPVLTEILQRGEYDLLQNSGVFPPDPFGAMNTYFHSSMTAPVGEATPGTNYFRYRNDEVDRLLDEVSSVVDRAQQRELYVRIQDIIADDVVFLPMYNIGERVPYYDGGRYAGWSGDAPIYSTRGIIEVYEIK